MEPILATIYPNISLLQILESTIFNKKVSCHELEHDDEAIMLWGNGLVQSSQDEYYLINEVKLGSSEWR